MHNMCSHTEGSKNLDLTHTLGKWVVSWVPLWALPAVCFLPALPAHVLMIFSCGFFCVILWDQPDELRIHYTSPIFKIYLWTLRIAPLGFFWNIQYMYFNVSIGLFVMAYLSVSICANLRSIKGVRNTCRIAKYVFFCRSLKLSVDINLAHVLVRDGLYRHHDVQKRLLCNM